MLRNFPLFLVRIHILFRGVHDHGVETGGEFLMQGSTARDTLDKLRAYCASVNVESPTTVTIYFDLYSCCMRLGRSLARKNTN